MKNLWTRREVARLRGIASIPSLLPVVAHAARAAAPSNDGFSANLLWGSATASYQVEGAVHEGGRAGGGGSPGSAAVVVDGFRNSSAMPPKSSIASIRINPDPFSAGYETPPWAGGRVEIYTKPGANAYHGALFFTESAVVFNATGPL
jgi:hypothetical protein